MGRYGEIWGDTEEGASIAHSEPRYGEIWGDMGLHRPQRAQAVQQKQPLQPLISVKDAALDSAYEEVSTKCLGSA